MAPFAERKTHRGTSPEAQLILACCAILSDSERRDRIDKLLKHPLDWDYLVAAAGNSASIPQVFRAIRDMEDSRIPADVMSDLHTFYQHNSIKNLMLIQELLRLQKLFNEQGIETLTYKGPSLATQYYGDPAARMFWDLDLLLRKKDLPAAEQILTEQQYIPEKLPHRIKQADFFESDCEYNFDRIDGKVHLEIHWDILPRHSSFDFDVESLWQNAIPVALGGSQVQTLCPEDLLLVLCVHAGDKHQWTALRMIQDISQVIAVADALDWDSLLSRMQSLKRMRTVLLGLYLANALLNASVPARIVHLASRDAIIPNLAALACGRIFRDEHGLPGYAEWKHYRMNLFTHPASPNFLQYGLSVLKPEFHDREELPGSLHHYSFLHYVARLKRLIVLRRAGLIRRLR